MVEFINNIRLKKYYGIIPGLIAFVVYAITTCRSIWIGDSGEFALALETLGICHPPGYPLFTITGRIFVMLMPFFRPIFAANLYNIFISAAAVTVIYYFFNRYLNRGYSVILSLLWGLTPVFWAETAGVEIYNLNLLLISLTLFASGSNKNWRWLLTIYLFGLSLANHPSALSILPVLVYLFIKDKIYTCWRMFPLYLFLLITAGSIYLYLPIRSSLEPISNWGNPDNITALVRHMTLSQYSGWINYSWGNFIYSVKLFLFTLLKSWSWVGLIIASLGAITGLFVNRTITISAFLMLISTLVLASSHQALNFEPFYIPAMFAALLFTGNIFFLLEKRFNQPVIKYITYCAGVIACVILFMVNFNSQDKSSYTLAEDYSKHILDSAGSGILFTAGDINSFTVLYLRYGEGYNSRVEVYDRSIRCSALFQKASRLTGQAYNNYYRARSAFIKHAGKNVYLTKNHYIHEPDWLNLREPVYSAGILYLLNQKPDSSAEVLKYPISYDPGDVLSRQLLVNLDLARGEHFLKEESPNPAEADRAFNLALKRLVNESRADVFNNLGVYFRRSGHLDLALKTYEMALSRQLITISTRKDITYNISNVYKDYGNNHLASENYDSALSCYRIALEYDRDNAILLRNIGMIYGQIFSDTSNALFYLKEYLNQNPSDSIVLRYIEFLK